jgi:hypothetical protein
MRISALPLLLAGLVACSDSPETGADTDTVDNDADNDSVENQDTQDSSESGDASDTASDVSVDVGPDDATDASETSDVDPDAPELTEPGTFVIGEAALPDEYVFKGVWAGEAGRIVAVGNDGIVASQSPEGEWQVLSRADGAELLNAVHGSDGRHLWAVGKDGAILPGTVDSFGDTGACEDDSDCVDDDACTLESCEEGRCIAASTGANGCCGSTPGSWNFETGSFSPWVNVGAEQIGPFPWQVVNRPGRATSGTFALWFGNAALGTYGGGEHLAGVIQSPNVRLPSTGTATLKFNVFLDAETDPSFDTLAVEVQESGVITEVWHKRELARVPTGTFVAAEADLTPWRGKVVQLRIVFDSIDGTINDFEGPYLDDIRVETECTASGAASGSRGPTLWGVYGLSPSLAFAVGKDGTLLQFNGERWSPAQGADSSAVWNAMTGFGDVVALVGNSGKAVISRGVGLEPVTTNTTANLQGVLTLDGENFTAVGDRGTILMGTAEGWTPYELGLSSSLRDVHGTRADDLYAVGYSGTIVHWNGTSWTLLESPTVQSLHGVFVTDTEVVIVGQAGRILVGDAASGFTEVAELAPGGELNDLWGTPDGSLLVAVGTSGRTYFRRNGEWAEQVADTAQTLENVWGTGPEDIWAVGRSGIALHWDGTAWEKVATPVSSLLAGLWGDASDRFFAAGAGGALMAWNGASWSSVAAGTKKSLRAVFGRAQNDVWAVGAEGTIVRFNGLGWGSAKVQGVPDAEGVEQPITEELYAVWAASATDGWAVGANGRMLRWDGVQWNIVESEWTTALRGVYGLASNDVWAVGTAGHILHFNGEAWEKVDNASIATLYAIHGDGAGHVVAVGDLGTVLRLSR